MVGAVRAKWKLNIGAALCLLASGAAAQDEIEFRHPGIEWNTIETEHFSVNFHKGAERTARVVAQVAEDVYEPVTSLYNHKPEGKVSFIIIDYDDISNGGAYFFDNKIEIYAPSMDFEFRGTHNWLRNVVTHEFTHVVQIQTSLKFGRHVPAVYLQWLGYESERRPDVLYGYPNVIATYPISGFADPVWFAEGIAQYNRTDLRYDFWDSHRDMILRSYALDSSMLSWESMGVFGKTSLGNESSYNAGFAFVRYIAQKYGEDKLQQISRNLASLTSFSIDGAIKDAVGKSGSAVYEDWRSDMERDYAARVAPVKTNLREGSSFIQEEGESAGSQGSVEQTGKFLTPSPSFAGAHQEACCRAVYGSGFVNLYPAYSPDGQKLAYVSTKGADYFGLASLYLYDAKTGKERLVQPGVHSSLCWSPDGNALYYTKPTRENPGWYLLYDVYRYDLVNDKEVRITHAQRATSPTASPDGAQLACVINHDGTTNIAVMKGDGTDLHQITHYEHGEQFYNLKWSPKGDRILFDYSIRDGRDIGWVRPDGTDLQFLIQGADDSRDGSFSPDGSRILFSSDRTGIFNVYSYDLASGKISEMTNVLGGAFYPTSNAAGDVVYSTYTSKGYKVVRLLKAVELQDSTHHYLTVDEVRGAMGSGMQANAGGTTSPLKQFDWNALRSYADSNLTPLPTHPYKGIFSSVSIMPLLRIDNYNTSSNGLDVVKPGVYLASQDLITGTGFFAGADINRRLERDLFLQFSYDGRVPLLHQLGIDPEVSLELYDVTRKTSTYVSLADRPPFPIDVTYHLFEFDFGFLGIPISSSSYLDAQYAHSSYSSALGSFLNTRTNSLVPASSDLYLIGNTLSAKYSLNAILPSSTDQINPVGRNITLRVSRELNKFASTDSAGFQRYEVTDAGIQPVYDKINFTRLEFDWKEHLPLFFPRHTLTVELHGGTILGKAVDEFFDFYGGGLIGMKGYPFYSLGGNSLATVGMTYRFPLMSNIDVRLGQIYLQHLYASVYGDIGDAWTKSKPALGDFKRDVGMEVRLDANSFYALPTKIFFNAAYGLDRFSQFIRFQNETVTYGKEWRFYLGVLFDFNVE